MWRRLYFGSSRGATYPQAALHFLVGVLWGVSAFINLKKLGAFGWLWIGGAVLSIAIGVGELFYRRRHAPPPGEQHWYDALG